MQCPGGSQVPGQTGSFLQHMQMGIQAAADDPSSLLVFSGGQTRLEVRSQLRNLTGHYPVPTSFSAAPQLLQLQPCAAVKAPPLQLSAMPDALAAAPGWLTLRGPELLVSQRCLRVVWARRGPQQSRYRGSLAALGLLAV